MFAFLDNYQGFFLFVFAFLRICVFVLFEQLTGTPFYLPTYLSYRTKILVLMMSLFVVFLDDEVRRRFVVSSYLDLLIVIITFYIFTWNRNKHSRSNIGY